MKYEAEVDGDRVEVELDERGGRVFARVGDREYDAEVVSPEKGVYLILAGDRVFEARVWAEGREGLRVKVRGRTFGVNVIDRKHLRGAAEHTDEGRQQLAAPMPGKVVRVLLKEGDEVAAGQGVIVVEAMKMQNEIKSPKAGRVVEIRVAEGATVNAGQVLAIVE